MDSVLPDRNTLLFKTDTQGFELEVLKGSRSWIERNKPALLLVELSYALLYHQKTSVKDVLDFIYSHLQYKCIMLPTHGRDPRWGRYKIFPEEQLINMKNHGCFLTFEDVTQILRAPVFNSTGSGWTDVLCSPFESIQT